MAIGVTDCCLLPGRRMMGPRAAPRCFSGTVLGRCRCLASLLPMLVVLVGAAGATSGDVSQSWSLKGAAGASGMSITSCASRMGVGATTLLLLVRCR